MNFIEIGSFTGRRSINSEIVGAYASTAYTFSKISMNSKLKSKWRKCIWLVITAPKEKILKDVLEIVRVFRRSTSPRILYPIIEIK